MLILHTSIAYIFIIPTEKKVLTNSRDPCHEGEPQEEKAEADQPAHARLVQLLLLQYLEERDVEQRPAGHALENADNQGLHVCPVRDVVGHDHANDDAERWDESQDDDVDNDVEPLRAVGHHVHADAEEDGESVDGDGEEQLPHIRLGQLKA